MSSDNDIRRDKSGAIDIAFYRERAERLRREAILEFVSTIRQRITAWRRRRRAGVPQKCADALQNVVRR